MIIRETELNLLVPSPELLVRLASQDRPMGISAGPPRIRFLRETYFDTADQALRKRGMTCKLRQSQGEAPVVVVTAGEGPDSEGITSRSRLTAASVGFGIFETLRGDSEVAVQIQKFVDPADLRPQISLDIQRLGRLHRSGLFRRPTLFLYFDRITIQAGGGSSVTHEIRIRRRRPGGPLIRDLGQMLRDEFHLFPDGLTTFQRAQRVLALERKLPDSELSPYALKLALALFKEGQVGLIQREELLSLPTFRGSGEDAARALASDLTGFHDLEIQRIGASEPREGRPVVEVWVAPDCGEMECESGKLRNLVWYPWHALLELVGRGGIRDPDLLSALLLLTRKRLSGGLDWIPPFRGPGGSNTAAEFSGFLGAGEEGTETEILAVDAVLPQLRKAEKHSESLAARLNAVRAFTTGLREIFIREVGTLKEQILSQEGDSPDPAPILLLDLLSVRIRGLVDRLYQVAREDLFPQLEERGFHVRTWAGIMREDRRALLELFSEKYLPNLQVVGDWGPAFVPEMPPAGCALGISARAPGSAATRFYHVVLHPETPSFLQIPGSKVVLPLEELIRGFLFYRFPELERAETHLFRFRTTEVTVRKTTRLPIVTPPPDADAEVREPLPADHTDADAEEGESLPPKDPDASSQVEGPSQPEVLVREFPESVVIHVLTHRKMPETHQAQLLRALERQVARGTPLIGWGDLYAVNGPLDLSGMAALLEEE